MRSAVGSHARLVRQILRMPGARDREIRDQYLVVLGSLLDRTPDFERSTVPDDDVAALVAWCAVLPGGLDRLVEAVAEVEQETAAIDRLRVLGQIGREVLEPHERDRIEALLSGLDPASVAGMFHDLASRWGPRLRPHTRDPRTLLRLLEDAIPGPGEAHPLYIFLNRLARKVRDAPEDNLDELVGEVGYRTGASGSASTESLEPADGGQHYFVVRLAEDGLTPSRYLLRVWLANDRGVWEERYTSDTAHLLDDIRGKVDEQLTVLADDPAVDINALSIEFILPRPLIDHDVDQWLVAAPGFSDAIGVHYPVVVRDLARMRNRIIRGRWRRRCQWLSVSATATATAGAVRFQNLHGSGSDSFAELMRDQERPACLVVQGQSAALVVERLGGWLSAGIPVVVWCRHDDYAARFDAHLPSVLTSGGVKVLRTAIWRLRQDSGGQDNPLEHVGRHITLLWDEVSRIPPDELQLRDPAQRG